MFGSFHEGLVMVTIVNIPWSSPHDISPIYSDRLFIVRTAVSQMPDVIHELDKIKLIESPKELLILF